MSERKAFLLRLDPATYDALQRWADAELRSLNAQIEFVLRRSLREAGLLRTERPGHQPRQSSQKHERDS
jgi:hypothetical protein